MVLCLDLWLIDARDCRSIMMGDLLVWFFIVH